MKLPNAEAAVVDVAKLRDYCLNPTHPYGRHKARVFRSALGLERDDAEKLRQALLNAAKSGEATLGEKDAYGQRYVIDFFEVGPRGNVRIRSCWIILRTEDFPRLTTCYVFD